jgi:hypothetical protein
MLCQGKSLKNGLVRSKGKEVRFDLPDKRDFHLETRDRSILF